MRGESELASKIFHSFSTIFDGFPAQLNENQVRRESLKALARLALADYRPGQ
jgi:hypothetical protein